MTGVSEEADVSRGAGNTRKRAPALVAAAMVAALLWPTGGDAQQAASQANLAGVHQDREHAAPAHELYFGAVLFEKLEYGFGLDGPNLASWEGLAFYGTDYNRAFFRTQGETTKSARRIESAEFQLLYSRLVGYYWDVQAGVRFDPGLLGRPNRTYGVAAIQGLAPGLFEVNGQVFVSETGAISFRAESSYDIYITQRLVLQPDAEINLAVQRDREIEAGAGFSDVEVGLRLRYEFTREVAPYIGINYERTFGETARFRRAEGERTDSWNFVTGLRLSF